MKKYNNKSNVIGSLIKTYRNKKGLSKIALCKKLQLFAVYRFYRVKTNGRWNDDYKGF